MNDSNVLPGGSRRAPARAGAAIATIATAILMALAGSARAELGGNAASVRQEARQAQASLRVSAFDAYEVHEMQTPGGAAVRQYLDRNGQVFALTWRSQGPADMAALLGRYYPTYRKLGATRVDLHHAVLHSPGLVVEVGGVARTFTGRAFLPGALPAGVTSARIR